MFVKISDKILNIICSFLIGLAIGFIINQQFATIGFYLLFVCSIISIFWAVINGICVFYRVMSGYTISQSGLGLKPIIYMVISSFIIFLLF